MKTLILNLALIGLGVVFALGLGEVTARTLWQAPPPPPARPQEPKLPEIRGSLALMKRNVRAVHKGVLYRTNSAGFRGREYSRTPPEGVFRIVAVGDSFTMGQGVVEEAAYPQVLERSLNQGLPDRRFEVLNLGIGGLNITRVVNRLERVGLPFRPDLIVYGCTWNDIRGPFYRESMGKKALQRQREVYSRFAQSPSYLLRVFWPRWKSLQELWSADLGTMMYELQENYFRNPEAWGQFTIELDRLARIQQEQEVPVVVFIHTVLSYLTAFHPFHEIYTAIEHAAAERGLTVIQSFESFRGWTPDSLWVNGFDFHPNPTGHQLLAQALRDGLEQHLPTPQ